MYISIEIYRLLNFFISVSSRTCSQRNPKIVGGQEVEKNEQPFIVSLTKRGGHFCGATIIHELWILTAGHCICNGLNKYMKPNQIQGIVGLHRIPQNHNNVKDAGRTHSPLQVNFKTIVPHPQYKCENVKNDIGKNFYITRANCFQSGLSWFLLSKTKLIKIILKNKSKSFVVLKDNKILDH